MIMDAMVSKGHLSRVGKEHMHDLKAGRSNILKSVRLGALVAGGIVAIDFSAGVGNVTAQAQAVQPAPIAADDVSWLFPPPTRPDDLKNLISMGDLSVPNSQDPTKRDPVWSDVAFQRFLDIAAMDEAGVAGTGNRIGLPTEARTKSNWFIAGVRVDAGAPGLSAQIRDAFGQSPQIRLVVQLVIRQADGTPVVQDIAGHLIFDFTTSTPDPPAQPGCFPRPKPDVDTFRKIVMELATLRTNLSDGQFGGHRIVTSQVPLGVHPGLMDSTAAAGVSQAMKTLLQQHLADQHLNAMAIMALPTSAPEPWIFLSMLKIPSVGFMPVRGTTLDGQQQFAELFRFGGAVAPPPHTNNRSPITCVNAAQFQSPGPPIANRSGSATADLFANPAPSAGVAKDILDLIADPTRSHFFNTDCVSCHTETRRAMELLLLREIKVVSGIDPAVLPNSVWTLRNFGWSPPSQGAIQAVVTRRTAAETAAVVAFINSQVLTK
jgi:hypothetical protein